MNRLKELRQEKNLTQQELANEIGVTKRTYIYWEKGERQIKTDKAKQLADFFGVPVGYLLGYSSIPPLLEKQLSEQEKEELRKNPQLANELSDLAWQKYTIKMNAIENKKHKPASITEIADTERTFMEILHFSHFQLVLGITIMNFYVGLTGYLILIRLTELIPLICFINTLS